MTELPPRLTGEASADLKRLHDYLLRLAGTLESVLTAPSAPLPVQEKERELHQAVERSAETLRALILKTAHESEKYTEGSVQALKESFVARSDFGRYAESVELQIAQSARRTVESYGYREQIEAAEGRLRETESYLKTLNGQIRRGVLEDPESGERIFGIAIAENLCFTGESVSEGGERYDTLAPGQTLGLYTAHGWQFWLGGVRAGWYDSADGLLHIRSLSVEEGLRLGGDWLMSSVGGFGIRYLGEP